MNQKQLRGSMLLLLGSMIWGAAFVAQRVGMDHIGPFWFNGIRMTLAGVVLQAVIWATDRKKGTKAAPAGKREQRLAGLICGVLLFAASSLQQVGLVSTGAGKAGFITALYVVLVPLTQWVLLKRNPGKAIWISVAMAVTALYLLCMTGSGTGEGLQTGDLLIMGCAICFTGQILFVDYYAARVDALRMSRDEFLVTGLLSMGIAAVTEPFTWEGVRAAIIPILYAGVLSGAVGYTLQIIGQRDTDPTVSSLLMCLESVFAVLTGVILLGERMSPAEAAGCVIMFGAVILAQISPLLAAKKPRARGLMKAEKES